MVPRYQFTENSLREHVLNFNISKDSQIQLPNISDPFVDGDIFRLPNLQDQNKFEYDLIIHIEHEESLKGLSKVFPEIKLKDLQQTK